MDRRVFSQKLIGSVVSYALFDSLFSTEAFGNAIKPITDHWVIRLNEYCNDLRKQAITPVEWQSQVEELYQSIDLADILRFIDFDRLIRAFPLPDLGVNAKQIKFPQLEGLPERTVFVKKIFGMQKDRAIIPHGHSNMSSAHLILKGEMHLRQYEKIGVEQNALLIKPTVDKVISMGVSSTISDEKDNVHWLIANTESAFTFDVIMLDLDGKAYDIHNIDILESKKLGNGSLRAPILDVNAALKKYGKETHH